MNLIYLIFITFNVILKSKFTFSTYLNSEANLLQVLNSYIEEKEMLLRKLTKYLDGIEKSYNATKNIVCPMTNDDYFKFVWKRYQILKRVTVDWPNFIKVLSNDIYISDKIEKSIVDHKHGVYADWILESNDYKLIRAVRNLINVPQTLSIKNQEKRQLLETQVKEQIELKLQNLKESLRNFTKIAEYTPETRYPYWDDYKKLCRGEVLLDPDNINLKCKYVNNNNPFLFIGPFKQEELYSDPQIFMYHDVLYDNEIKTIQKLTTEQEMLVSQGKETIYRVAKVTWMHLKKINQRIHLMTNLTMTAADLLQVSVYGLAGHYEPHYDSGLDKSDPTHLRISTILFYMNDVTKGGNTVFPYLKLGVTPRKGSAIFWYNIMPNYEVDTRTLHAGCPLYSGIKWVMNSWVKRTQQEFTKPCMAEHKDSFIY